MVYLLTYFYYLLFYPWSLLVLTFSHFTPLQFVFSEGEGVRIPATSYLVPLFTLIYLVLFHFLLPSHLDVPCYLDNRQRYCSVWPEKVKTLYIKRSSLLLSFSTLFTKAHPLPHSSL